MTGRTKLLTMVTEALDVAPPYSERQAQAAIDAVAEWFEEVLETMGITPSSIPTLLQWQAHQHEYLGEDASND
jgi:hypothetical protein